MRVRKRHDVVGLGSPLLDLVVRVDDDVLAEIDLPKGRMRLIDSAESGRILKKLKNHAVEYVPGGSAANTLAGLALLGSRSAFIGVIGKDAHGDTYENKTVRAGVHAHLIRHNVHVTGHAITFITPDGERTFATHLGAASHFQKEHVAEDVIRESKALYVEGYQLEQPLTRAAVVHAMEIAKKHGTLIAMDLSDAGLIGRAKDTMKEIVEKYVDIVFANEEEAFAFTGKRGEAALRELAAHCPIAIVKRGEKGSMVQANGVVHHIAPHPVTVVNTNGAGDSYAAGMLHGIINHYDIPTAGALASRIAAFVVASPGARIHEKHHGDIKKLTVDLYRFTS